VGKLRSTGNLLDDRETEKQEDTSRSRSDGLRETGHLFIQCWRKGEGGANRIVGG
jgi:hypothetical protein